MIRVLIWNIYKFICYSVGTLFLIYIFLLGIMFVSKEFDTTELPNGVYITKGSIFSGDKDIWLWSSGGAPLFEGGVEFICFNNDYVYATVYDDVRSFIYAVTEDKVVTTQNQQEYRHMIEKSKLHSLNSFCDGYFKKLIGVNLLLKKPWLLQNPEEPR
jgi:hypothetical protein